MDLTIPGGPRIEGGRVGPRLPLVAGPCTAEGPALVEEVAHALAELRAALDIAVVLKTSFDKANRTSLAGARGPGLSALPWLAEIAQRHALPLCVDVHLPEQVSVVAEVADVIQIPALLSRQTDLAAAVAASGRPVLLKRGPFLSPGATCAAAAKLEALGCRSLAIVERGVSFGYERLVVDPAAIATIAAQGWPLLIDASHASQLPGSLGDRSGGSRATLPAIARAGLAAGAQGVFLEVHPDPARAVSDPFTQVPLARLEPLVRQLVHLHRALWSLPAAGALS